MAVKCQSTLEFHSSKDMRTFLIGDVHGCWKELGFLLDMLEHEPEDHIIFVGDLIHRGPDSGIVVATVQELSKKRRVTIVEGNHEEKHRRWRRAVAEGREHRMSNVEHYRRAEEEMKRRGVQGWLDRDLPLFILLPEFNSVVLHGGLLPDHELPDTDKATQDLSAKKRKSLKKILRVRHVSPEGKMVKLGHKTDKDSFWADLYDGRFGHVFFGHHPFADDDRPREYKHATSLDLGCVFGGHLVAAILKSGNPEPEFVAVEALETYCEDWTPED